MNFRKISNTLTVIVVIILLIIINIDPVFAEVTDNNINFGKIDEFVISKMKSERIPGVSLAIVKGSDVIYLKGFGVDGKKQPVNPQTPFVLGSVSKSFTGLAIMQLAEDEKIDLDAPVVKYLNSFTTKNAQASNKITIKQLLGHTSGFSTYDGREILLNDNIPIEQVTRNLKNTNLNNSLLFQYSNINYVLLGDIIQTVSGIPYGEYIEKNIFGPLEMINSYTNQKEAIEKGFTSGYKSYFGFILPTRQTNHEGSVPAGYLISSAEDMSHYLIAQMNDGFYNNNSIISKNGMDQTHSPISLGSDYGMGWGIERSRYVFSHSGDTENFHSDIRVNKHEGLGIVILFNLNDYITSSVLTNSNIYSHITDGILAIIHNKEPFSSKSKFNISLIRSLFNVAYIVILLLLALDIFKVFRWKNKFKRSKLRISFRFFSILIVNLMIPIGIVFILPDILANRFLISIRMIMLLIPDFALLFVLIPTILFASGIAKIMILLSFSKTPNSKEL